MYDPYDYSSAYISFGIDKESIGRQDSQFDPVVHAKSALFGLMYWNANHCPQQPLPELPDFMVGRISVWQTNEKHIDTEDADQLFTAAIAVCERTWNQTPELAGEDEEKALEFLKWLREHGDITKLKIRGEEYDIDERSS